MAPRSRANAIDPALVGAALKSARTAAGLTMTALAQRAGVTQPFISQVEGGSISPSLATLYGLAQALDVPPTALLPASPGGVTVVRAGEGVTIAQSDVPASPVARMLTGGGRHLEVSEFEVPVGLSDDTPFAHPGEELVYVLAGQLRLTLEDDEPIELSAGDSVHFDATRTHRAVATGAVTTRYLLVAAHPHRKVG